MFLPFETLCLSSLRNAVHQGFSPPFFSSVVQECLSGICWGLLLTSSLDLSPFPSQKSCFCFVFQICLFFATISSSYSVISILSFKSLIISNRFKFSFILLFYLSFGHENTPLTLWLLRLSPFLIIQRGIISMEISRICLERQPRLLPNTLWSIRGTENRNQYFPKLSW